jgi:nitrogen regulatory protein PII
MLKLIRCALTLENWEQVVSSVLSVGAGITVYCMREVSPEMTRRAMYRCIEYEVHSPGILMEIVIDDSWLEDITAKIASAQKNNVIGGRTIQVFPVERSYRLRDGFMDV